MLRDRVAPSARSPKDGLAIFGGKRPVVSVMVVVVIVVLMEASICLVSGWVVVFSLRKHITREESYVGRKGSAWYREC